MATLPKSTAEVCRHIKQLLQEAIADGNDAGRLDELRRVMTRLIARGDLAFGICDFERDTAKKWNSFLQKQHQELVKQLCSRIQTQSQKTAMRTMLGVIASTPLQTSSGKSKRLGISTELMYQLLQSIVFGDPEKLGGLIKMMESEFILPYRDVQYGLLLVIQRLSNKMYEEKANEATDKRAQVLMNVILSIPIPLTDQDLGGDINFLFPQLSHEEVSGKLDGKGISDDESSDNEEEFEDDASDDEAPVTRGETRKRKGDLSSRGRSSLSQAKTYRKALGDAWLALLKLPLPPSSLKRALIHLPKHVLPLVTRPLRFADFFTNAYGKVNSAQSVVISMLALEGLYYLMMNHELEYQGFYRQLYILLKSPQLWHAKHRLRCSQLLARSISGNSMLPAHLVAAFCKRLCRSALEAPPGGALFILALVSNLLLQHPETSKLLNQDVKSEDGINDAFDARTDDPALAKALDSSLWELNALSKHYHPSVATLAKSIGSEDPNTTPLHNLQDFSSHTYKSLFDQERKRGDRKKKRRVALTFEKPKEGLFAPTDMFASILFLPDSTR